MGKTRAAGRTTLSSLAEQQQRGPPGQGGARPEEHVCFQDACSHRDTQRPKDEIREDAARGFQRRDGWAGPGLIWDFRKGFFFYIGGFNLLI
jgi:hypothetical protein